MELQSNNQYTTLLSSQAYIWNHIFSLINSMSLKCAIELQIPDIIHRHGAPMLLSELVEALPINKEKTQFVYRLMRILVHSGFFVKQRIPKSKGDNDEEKEGYLLAPVSQLLLRDEPLSVRPYFQAMLDPLFIEPWQHMSKWFQNNDVNPFYTAHGTTLWDVTSQEPRLNQLFNEAMASDARLIANIVLKHFRGVFEGLNSIVDVAGGIGTFAEEIANSFPNVSCICFDLPHVVNGLVGCKNLSYVAGDMFEAIPKAEAILLKWILHDWNDEECIKILKRCKEAIPSKENGGKLIIIEMVVEDQEIGNKSYETELFLDMHMMTMLTGKERTKEEWVKLFHDAGFSDYKITPTLGLRSLIEVYP